MSQLLNSVLDAFPDLHFEEADSFYWSPDKNVVFYTTTADPTSDFYSLCHEVAHTLLGHATYSSDIELLRLEMAAWNHAHNVAQRLHQQIPAEHIEACLDTYRDWLFTRSQCPRCNAVGIQQGQREYACFNCHTSWSVGQSRFCRTYRRAQIKKPASLGEIDTDL